MGKDKKSKISLFFLLSYIVLIPLINGFMKILEKCFNTNLNTIDINFLNLFTVIFRNGTIFIIWVILNLIIILVAKNISTTKERKDRSRRCKSKKERWNIWNSGLGKQTRNTRIFKYRKKRWNYSRRN